MNIPNRPLSHLLQGAIFGLMLSTTAMAAPTTEQWKAFNQNTAEHHVIPRYEQLAASAKTLTQATAGLCKNPNAEGLKASQVAFNDTMDAWQGIQHIRSGPIETMMRNYSMQFWPDKKNHVGKHLDDLIRENNPATLTSDDFYSITVAVRGLPAIERLLYSKEALKQLQSNPYRCQVLARISAYVEEMAVSISDEWKRDMLPEFKHTGDDEDLFLSNEEAAVTFLKPMVETIEVDKELKILRVLGSDLKNTKPRRLESWRSQRSLRNLQLNIDAIEAIYRGENGGSPSLRDLISSDEQKTLDGLFAEVQQQLHHYQQPMENVVKTEEGYAHFTAVAGNLEKLLKAIEATVTNNGVFLGFNSRDGD